MKTRARRALHGFGLGLLIAGPLFQPARAAAPAAPGHQTRWPLSEFTYLVLAPREGGAANDQPAKLALDFLSRSLGSIQLPDQEDAPTLFASGELAGLVKPLREAFAVAGPEEDVLLLSTNRRGGSFMSPPTGITARLFCREGRMQIIVHDARYEFVDRYRVTNVPPRFTFGSRTGAGRDRLAAPGAESPRADWLAFPLQAVEAASPAAGLATPAAPVPADRPKAAPADILERLRTLKKALEERLVTQEEFDRKQQELLKEL
jgi:hypothetical protein